MKIIIINGPNLNLVGTREKSVYGQIPFHDYFADLQAQFPHITLHYFQSNVEGELINKLHEVGFSYTGIILNAGGYTHTSVSLGDAIAAINTPVLEVHISNIYAREDFRHKSYLSKHCQGIIAGMGLDGYTLALVHLISKMQFQ
ncbi:MAG: type II 3-dehydroquinate dehydratase [Bacteroidota bacterium]